MCDNDVDTWVRVGLVSARKDPIKKTLAAMEKFGLQNLFGLNVDERYL